MNWQWYVSQAFALVGLVFVVISTQQKSTKKYILLYLIATISVVVGLCFLGEISALILSGAGIIRNLISLYFAYHEDANKKIKLVATSFVLVLIVVLNIVFWQNYLNLLSILVGTLLVICFIQDKSSRMRIWMVIAEIVSIVYYSLLLAPINVAIEFFGLVSAIVGIIRLDLKKTPPENPESN